MSVPVRLEGSVPPVLSRPRFCCERWRGQQGLSLPVSPSSHSETGGEGVRCLLSLLATGEELAHEEPDFSLFLLRRFHGERDGEEDKV